MALASCSISSGVNPARALATGSTWKTLAGPLMVFSMPFSTSTTPGIFLMASPTRVAQSRSTSGSSQNSLMAIGSGSFERSPISSSSFCTNSMSMTGSAFVTRSRTSSMTSSVVRLRLGFRRTEISPRLASVTAAKPSSRPVRREVVSTSGTWLRMRSMWESMRFVSCSDDPAGVK